MKKIFDMNENEEGEIPENKNSEELEKSNRKMIKKLFLFIFILCLIGLSFWAGLQRGKTENFIKEENSFPPNQTIVVNKDRSDNILDFSLFWKTWDLLKQKYVDEANLDSKKLMYGAILGMLQATGDPYTTFFTPDQNKQFNEDITGTFEGIGAELAIKNGVLTVVAPIEGTPAEKSGLKSGDKILKVDGKETSSMTVDEAVSNMRGPKGTTVKLTIFREGSDETQDVIVTRDVINIKSVKLEMKDNGIAYVKISIFGENTTKEFNSAASQISKNNAKGIILDLRNNPGGYLDDAVDIASRMIPKGKAVVQEESGDKSRKQINTKGGDLLSGIKTVILINEGSASASEILTGALRDNRDNITIVGKKSFGKGSVQELVPLSDGSAAKITVARWLTPNGDQINEKGIEPSVSVDLTNDDFQNNRDPQLDKALELAKQ
jgi:carboxyl-terminal processing protease